jgi:hypothetical protein
MPEPAGRRGRQLRGRDQASATAPRDRRGRLRDADAPGEPRRDHRVGRRRGVGTRGALRDREHREGPADALHPRGAARQARRDRPDGLRGDAEAGEGAIAPIRALATPLATWSGRCATRRCTRGRKPHARPSPRGRTSSSMHFPRERRRRSSSTSRPPSPRWPASSSACSAARWRASPTTRRHSATGERS